MNEGILMEDKDRIYVYPFFHFQGVLPLEELKNGIISKEEEGYYSVTGIESRTVNPKECYVVKNGRILENPFELSTERVASLFGKNSRQFELVEDVILAKMDKDAFIRALIKNKFYKTDKKNFKREMIQDRINHKKYLAEQSSTKRQTT